MKKDRLPVRIGIALMGLALLLPGCNDSEKANAKPHVVQKKLAAQADRSQPASNAIAVEQPQAEALASEAQHLRVQVKPEMPPTPAPEPIAPPKPKPPPPTEAPSAPATLTAAKPVVAGMVSQASLPPPDGTNKVAPSMAVAEIQEAAVPHIKAPEPYTAKGKADPFEPLLRDETVSNIVQLKPKKRSPNTPLEKIDIGQLKLVAIIAATSGNLAMVQESSGKGYLLRPGTLIGTNSGKVLSIEVDKVLFEEEYEDIQGKTITQKKEITLPKPPGEL